MKTLSLVIPAYNEDRRLPALLGTLRTSADAAVEAAGMRLLETIVVDDGSTDETSRMLEDAKAADPKLVPLAEFESNRGKGAAFAAGAEWARGDYVLLADADLSTPLEELHKLTAALAEGADLAIGSRAIEGAVVERGPLHRKMLGAAFNGTVRTLTGLRLRDTQCGFKLLPAETTRQLLAGQMCPGFSFDVELLMRADLAGLRIAEVPVRYVHDSRSRVKVASASVRMLRDVAQLSYRLRLRRGTEVRSAPARGPLAGVSADDAD